MEWEWNWMCKKSNKKYIPKSSRKKDRNTFRKCSAEHWIIVGEINNPFFVLFRSPLGVFFITHIHKYTHFIDGFGYWKTLIFNRKSRSMEKRLKSPPLVYFSCHTILFRKKRIFFRCTSTLSNPLTPLSFSTSHIYLLLYTNAGNINGWDKNR